MIRSIRAVSVLSAMLLFSSTMLLTSIAQAQLSYRQGQHVEPAYEGWWENEDGTYSFIFGYFNENWEQEIDVPVGMNNYFSPGEADRGQPTHFLPRRNRFTFEVVVPADWEIGSWCGKSLLPTASPNVPMPRLPPTMSSTTWLSHLRQAHWVQELRAPSPELI